MTESRKGRRQLEGHPAVKRLFQTTRMPDEDVFSIPHRLSRGLNEVRVHLQLLDRWPEVMHVLQRPGLALPPIGYLVI